MATLLNSFKTQLINHRYASSSIKSYLACCSRFLEYFAQQDLAQLQTIDIANYLQFLIAEEQISPSYQKQMLRAIAKFYELCLYCELNLASLYPQQTKANPQSIGRSDVKNMLHHTVNLKHSCVLKLLYGSGLRVSEVLELKKQDIDWQLLLVYVRNIKGQKKRSVMLSQNVLADLSDYLEQYRPKHYLFEGQEGKQYTAKSVQNLVRKAAKRAGISQRVTPYVLRHSFAIHLLEKGTQLELIQGLLGHQSLKTTEAYTLLADNEVKVSSPLDSF